MAVFCASPLFASDKSLFSTQRPADLRKDPEEGAPLQGRIPKGTVVRYQGRTKNGFVEVEVELVQGSVTGWLPLSVAPARFQEESLSEPPDEEEEKRLRRSDEDQSDDSAFRPTRKVKIPLDEGILLRRDPTFFYGLQAGGGLTIMDAGVVSPDYFLGPVVLAGGHVGYFLSRAIPMKFEINYNLHYGTEPTGKIAPLSIGFLQAGLSISYLVEQFEVFGGFSYGLGISVNDLDPKIKIASPQDLSSPFFNAGLGYLIPLGDISHLAIRVRYDVSLYRTPVGFQSIAGMLGLEFRG